MKKYLLLSVFIHALALSFFYVKYKSPKIEKEIEKEIVTGFQSDPLPIEINTEADELVKKNKDQYYWGLGLAADFGDVDYLGYKANSIHITKIYPGYCGENSGIMIGDNVYMINGELYNEQTNDIKGNEPKKLILTLDRNGRTIVLQTERCKIWY